MLTGPEDPAYEALRRCYNGLIGKRPLVIGECRGTADVAAAVRFAVDEGLELAVRGGGHSPGARGLRRRPRGRPRADARGLHPHAPAVGGLIAHPLEAAPALLRFYREFTQDVPDELAIFAALVHAPDGSGMPLDGLVVCHAGEQEAALRDVRPLTEWARRRWSRSGRCRTRRWGGCSTRRLPRARSTTGSRPSSGISPTS